MNKNGVPAETQRSGFRGERRRLPPQSGGFSPKPPKAAHGGKGMERSFRLGRAKPVRKAPEEPRKQRQAETEWNGFRPDEEVEIIGE